MLLSVSMSVDDDGRFIAFSDRLIDFSAAVVGGGRKDGWMGDWDRVYDAPKAIIQMLAGWLLGCEKLEADTIYNQKCVFTVWPRDKLSK